MTASKGLRRLPPTCHPDRPVHARRLCRSCYGKWLRETNPEYYANKKRLSRQWEKNNPERLAVLKRRSRLWSRYGLTEETYNAMVEKQAGLCAICKFRPVETIDHDHVTGIVRGLLCHQCNKGLGHFEDNLEIMTDACEYLRQYDHYSIIR